MRRFRSPKMKRKTPPVNTHDSIHDALDALDSGEGTATAPTGNGTVSVEVVAVDRLGVKVRKLSVSRGEDFDLVQECAESIC